MSWAPILFLPAPLRTTQFGSLLAEDGPRMEPLPLTDSHFMPHYPAKSPLDDVLRLVAPGSDEYVTEKYAFEISRQLGEWSAALTTGVQALSHIEKFLDAAFRGAKLRPSREISLRSGYGIEAKRRIFTNEMTESRQAFLEELRDYFSSLGKLETAEFQIIELQQTGTEPITCALAIRYDLVGQNGSGVREERIGHWKTGWSRDTKGAWKALEWRSTEEIVSDALAPVFVDVTAHTFGQTDSYRKQLFHGVDHWRTVLDGACGIDVYGNNGLAIGDFDNDGVDDLYVCQPAGLPNRLYRNRGDGTFEDVTEKSGVGVLDGTACALFADFENKGLQDLLVVCASGPLLFLNQGNGKFSLKRDAFQFVTAPQGTFTHAAAADYDHDGRLDIYFCLYSYYLGLDQYHYPAPYFNARNGPPNFLMRNLGNGKFEDVTQASGLNAENDRFSFACAWGDSNSDGWPDLYVANDFGRSNLYRNNGNGTFTAVSDEARVNDAGAGMSASWFDFDNDGNQDIYVANMWSAAGRRVTAQSRFHDKDSESVRDLYRQHAAGNSLYRNNGSGHFENVNIRAGVAMGRWAWASDAWDFDHDGYPDLYIANGYVSGSDRSDVSSFFWRQVVAKSPQNSSPSPNYERGWNAINELIRSDSTWSGYERNVFFLNNHDGTFSEVSGTAGLDFQDDSRSFVLSDIDGDGRLEMILKNRTAPQLRVLKLATKEIGNSVALRLKGTKSNRDAIGTAVTVVSGSHRQTKYLQAGSGFLSQHTKELFFGVGKTEEPVSATVRWPSGLTQNFENLPVNHRIEFQEGTKEFLTRPFVDSKTPVPQEKPSLTAEPLPATAETWLIEPLKAPDFSLSDVGGKTYRLDGFQGRLLLLSFSSPASSSWIDHLKSLQEIRSSAGSNGTQVVAIALTEQQDVAAIRSLVVKEGFAFPVLPCTNEVGGIYNILYRYLFDRRRDLPIPASLLVDERGMIAKIYQGRLNVENVLRDTQSLPKTPEGRIQKALPFQGTLYLDKFQRNAFTYGVALFQRGYLEQAATAFKQVVAQRPDDPEAYYNLGTLCLRRNDLADAVRYLQQTVKLRPSYPEAWNNLGMAAAQQGQPEEAIRNFEQSLSLRPDYVVALVNLGNLYRRQNDLVKSEKLLAKALELEPENPEAVYSMGMLYARQEQFEHAAQLLEKAVALRSDYAEALNNLGVLFIREHRNADAENRFKECIRVAPDYDQAYLNLARLYALSNEKQQARAVLEELLKRQPEHKLARQTLEMLN